MDNIKARLETERLIFRPLTASDFGAVHSWAGNTANARYMAWGPNSEEQGKAMNKVLRA